MKISSLSETVTPSSTPNGNNPSSAPTFGRDPKVLETTVAGNVGGGAPTNMGMQSRNNKGSNLLKGIKTSRKFANSRKAGIKEEAISEDDISEEQLLTKAKREEFFNKPKTRDIGDKPHDRDIMAKEEFNGGGEYNDEVDMVQNNLHTIVRVSTHLGKELHADENLPEWVQEKIAVAKSVMVTVMDYMISQHERGNVYTVDENVEGPDSRRDEYTREASALKAWLNQNSHDQYADHFGTWSTWNEKRKRYEKLLDLLKHLGDSQGMAEVAPPGAKAERMVKHIKKSYSKDGKLSPKEKSIAYATAWKAHNKGTVEGVAEGNDDIWGPQGNFAGDTKVELGGASIKPISKGDMVKYFGEPAQVVELSKDKKVARIIFKNRALTQNVKTSDLAKLGQGVAEGEGGNYYSIALQMYPQLKQVDRATVITALNSAYEDYLMHYGYEGIGPDEERSMIDRAIKGLKQGVAEGSKGATTANALRKSAK